MSWTEIIALLLAAAAGGAINAVAGGGTLVTFPTLLFFRTPAIVANATSTLALVLGTSGSLYGYRQHIAPVRTWLWRFVPVSLVGGAIGAWLLTRTAERTFSQLVPFLILFATVLFLLQGAVRRWINFDTTVSGTNKSFGVWLAVAFQFGVAVYGGYFGAGIGILMLAALGFIGLRNIYEMNTLKTILGSLINLIAALWFVCAGLVNWPKAGVMTIGAMFGYYLGAHYSQRLPQARVKQIITAIGFTLSAITFYQQFIRSR
jgi:uncharacterized membrane protein YfcA